MLRVRMRLLHHFVLRNNIFNVASATPDFQKHKIFWLVNDHVINLANQKKPGGLRAPGRIFLLIQKSVHPAETALSAVNRFGIESPHTASVSSDHNDVVSGMDDEVLRIDSRQVST